MKDIRAFLTDLLQKEVWTKTDREGMLEYLERSDTDELKALLQEEFEKRDAQLPLPVSEQLLQNLHQRLGFEQQPEKVRRLWKPLAAAASVLVVAAAGWLLWKQAPETKKMADVVHTVKDTAMPTERLFVNTSDAPERIQLPDGSVVILEKESELSYQLPFNRKVTVTGALRFNVAASKLNPFTVTSRDITTTVLGTDFLVTAHKAGRQLKVRLYSGKVLVKAVEKNNWRMKQEYYLLPGQEFVYSNDAYASVRTVGGSKTAPQQMAALPKAEDISLPNDKTRNWYMFNNQSLGKVLNDLEMMYQQKIVYDTADISNIWFTGKYNKKDSLEAILKRIGKLNNLHIQKVDSGFIIKK